jgi:formylglycine-generating enzyme required for sulfatase activity
VSAGLSEGLHHVKVKAEDREGFQSKVESRDFEVQPSPPRPVKKVVIPGIGGVYIEMVLVPEGEFRMGSPDTEADRDTDEGPVRTVKMTPYWIGKFEVTKSQWKSVMATEPWNGKGLVENSPESPAVSVSWDDVQEFIKVLNAKVRGVQFRLPSEAEWEYACRSGTQTRFGYGDDPDYSGLRNYAWYIGDTWVTNEEYAHPKGTKGRNDWGLYDMHGNVWEWCADRYNPSYEGAPQPTESAKRGNTTKRVLRGGSHKSLGHESRSANRDAADPDEESSDYGFRLVMTERE